MSGYTVKVYSEQSSEQEKVGIVHWKDKKWKLYRNNLALLLHLWFSIIIYIYIYYYTYYNLKNSQDFRFNYYRSLWSFNVFILSRVFLNVYRIREIKVKKKKEKNYANLFNYLIVETSARQNGNAGRIAVTRHLRWLKRIDVL